MRPAEESALSTQLSRKAACKCQSIYSHNPQMKEVMVVAWMGSKLKEMLITRCSGYRLSALSALKLVTSLALYGLEEEEERAFVFGRFPPLAGIDVGTAVTVTVDWTRKVSNCRPVERNLPTFYPDTFVLKPKPLPNCIRCFNLDYKGYCL